MIIAVDIDNVLNNLTEKVIELYNADSGDCLALSDITCYSIESFMKPDFHHRLGYYFSCAAALAKPQPGAVEFIQKLSDDGHDIYYVTSTTYSVMPTKIEWLQRHFGLISARRVVRLHDKYLFKCDIMIDDCLFNLSGDGYRKILLDYPWNRVAPEFDEMFGIERAQNWEEIYRFIKDSV